MKSMHIFGLAALALLLPACQSSNENESLRSKNADLVARNIDANADLDSYRAYLTHIESRLGTIRSEQEQLVEYLQFADDRPTGKPIDDHLNHLEYLLDDSRFQVAGMREEVRKSAQRLQQLRAASTQKDEALEARSASIDSLSHALTERVIALELLELHQREMAAALRSSEDARHLAWYAYGTWDELEDAGVVEKTGGFLGIGKRKILRPDFDAGYFVPVDMREVKRIPLHSSAAKVLSMHAESSYHLENEGEQLVLVIDQPADFWRSSRYLAVSVEQ